MYRQPLTQLGSPEIEIMTAILPSVLAPRQEKQLQSQTRPAAARKPSILVVDDEALIASVLDTRLRQAGFTVYLACSGCGALELYSRLSSDIDLVLLDVCLPDLHGPQILAELRAMNPAIRFCFMTSGGGHYTREQLLHQGASRVFDKPFRLTEIVDELRELAGAKRS